MTDKNEKEKQTSSCCSSKKEIPIVPIAKESSCCSGENTTIKEDITKETSSCCSSKKEIPIIPITKETSCCSSNNDSTKIENSSSCCSSELALEKEQTKSNSSCCSDNSCEDPSPSLDTQKILGDGVQTYLVEGMDCGACALTIEKHLQNVSGVKEVRVNFANGKMHIRHDRDMDDIIKEVSNAGFGASLAGARKGSAPVQKAKNTTLILSGFIFSFRGLGEVLQAYHLFLLLFSMRRVSVLGVISLLKVPFMQLEVNHLI